MHLQILMMHVLLFQVMIDAAHDAHTEEPKKEVDFFEEHEKLQLSHDGPMVRNIYN